MNDSEEKLRQEAIRLYLQDMSVSCISRELSRSRQWVHKWIAKYKNNPSTDWYKSESRAPKRIANVTPIDIEKTIVKARRDLVSRQYSQQGAISILYELDRIKVKAPSISTSYPIPQTTDHRPQTTDHRPQTTDHRPQTSDHRPQTSDHRPQTPNATPFGVWVAL